MEDNEIVGLVIAKLNNEDMWFTQKTDPTWNNPSHYYKLDEYGEPTEAAVKQIVKEVTKYIGDGAVDVEDAINIWIGEACNDCRVAYTGSLVTKFKDKPVVDGIEAFETKTLKESVDKYGYSVFAKDTSDNTIKSFNKFLVGDGYDDLDTAKKSAELYANDLKNKGYQEVVINEFGKAPFVPAELDDYIKNWEDYYNKSAKNVEWKAQVADVDVVEIDGSVYKFDVNTKQLLDNKSKNESIEKLEEDTSFGQSNIKTMQSIEADMSEEDKMFYCKTSKFLDYISGAEVEIPEEYTKDYDSNWSENDPALDYMEEISGKSSNDFKGDNSYNWGSHLYRDINIESVEGEDGYYYVAVKCHIGGDVRANYTDYALYKFDNDYDFTEALMDFPMENDDCGGEFEYKGHKFITTPQAISEYNDVCMLDEDGSYGETMELWGTDLEDIYSQLDEELGDILNNTEVEDKPENESLKKTEGVKRRIAEENNKSLNLISDMFQAKDFNSDSKQGQIVMRTSNLFNVLSDRGYDVQVSFDNGESTNAILLGQQGGQVIITITNTDQPLRAFTSGNFEVTDDNLKILDDIQNQISSI